MSIFQDPNLKPVIVDLLSAINEHLAQLGCKASYLKLPEVDPEIVKSLSGKKILMVDDSDWIENWVPILIVATNNCASAIFHEASVSEQNLIGMIARRNPDIILLDKSLAGGVQGNLLVEKLKNELPLVKIFGFSSSDHSNQLLIKAGAVGAADKTEPDTNIVLKEIIKVCL